MRYVKSIKKEDENYIINDKYIIYGDGVIYYAHWYVGKRGDFPRYLFKLRNELLNMED